MPITKITFFKKDATKQTKFYAMITPVLQELYDEYEHKNKFEITDGIISVSVPKDEVNKVTIGKQITASIELRNYDFTSDSGKKLTGCYFALKHIVG